MADILSQEEIDALLSATDGDEGEIEDDMGSGGFDDASSQRIITPYDFKHPARVNKDQLRTLENLHDNFARLLSSTFSGAMRAVVDRRYGFCRPDYVCRVHNEFIKPLLFVPVYARSDQRPGHYRFCHARSLCLCRSNLWW